jgi:hypothetical protein
MLTCRKQGICQALAGFVWEHPMVYAHLLQAVNDAIRPPNAPQNLSIPVPELIVYFLEGLQPHLKIEVIRAQDSWPAPTWNDWADIKRRVNNIDGLHRHLYPAPTRQDALAVPAQILPGRRHT